MRSAPEAESHALWLDASNHGREKWLLISLASRLQALCNRTAASSRISGVAMLAEASDDGHEPKLAKQKDGT